MNSNFNRQFILIDFDLVDDPKFIGFFNSAEFGTYLILRRYIWRGGEKKPHFLGLHELYEEDRLLVSSISRERLAALLQLKDVTRVSKHLTRLEQEGVVRRIRTGRQSIYVLGEWVDYSEEKDGSKRIEWFYLDRQFGLAKSDVAKKATSEVGKSARQMWSKTPQQTWPKMPPNNREENRESKPVNGDENIFGKLALLNQPKEQREEIAQHLAAELNDRKSMRFYQLIAAKVPEEFIYRALAEAKQEGDNPAKLFTHKMKLYALGKLKGKIASGKR